MSNKILDIKIKPQLVPFKCVVCNGFGTVNWGKASCHACQGRGYILIPGMQAGETNKEKEKEEDGENRF